MEKKVEVEIDGRKYRIAEHMLEDASRFGASVIKRQTKPVPAELLKVPEIKKTILPPIMEFGKEDEKEVEKETKVIEQPKKVTRKKATK